MFDLFSDPALMQTAWTATITVLLIGAAGLTLAILPWADRDIAAVDQAFQNLVSPPGRRATLPR